MPRKEWVPKCSYAKRSKLSDAEFRVILLLWIYGDSAEEAVGNIQRQFGTSPSEKTVSAYYKRIADAIFDSYEPSYIQLATDGGKDAPDMEAFYRTWHEEATRDPEFDLATSRLLHILENNGIATIDFEAIKLEYRNASIAQRGVAQRVKQTLAWATVREEGRSMHRATYKHFVGIDDVIAKTIFMSLIARFLDYPC